MMFTYFNILSCALHTSLEYIRWGRYYACVRACARRGLRGVGQWVQPAARASGGLGRGVGHSIFTLQRTYPLPPSKILEKVGVNEHTSDSQCQNLDLPVSYRFASHEMVRSSQCMVGELNFGSRPPTLAHKAVSLPMGK